MKLKNLILALPVFALVIISCNNSKTSDMNDDGLTKEEKRDDKGPDAEFLRAAAETNLDGIYLSELAATSATMQETKDMATMFINDHKNLHAEVIALATKLGISIPTYAENEAQRKYENLSKKEGANFDKEYSDVMVKYHKDAIDSFEKAAEDCENAEVKTLANNTLPKLREHLTHAEHCQEMAKDAK